MVLGMMRTSLWTERSPLGADGASLDTVYIIYTVSRDAYNIYTVDIYYILYITYIHISCMCLVVSSTIYTDIEFHLLWVARSAGSLRHMLIGRFRFIPQLTIIINHYNWV